MSTTGKSFDWVRFLLQSLIGIAVGSLFAVTAGSFGAVTAAILWGRFLTGFGVAFGLAHLCWWFVTNNK